MRDEGVVMLNAVKYLVVRFFAVLRMTFYPSSS
jgi:hypothetical protein